MWNRHLGDWASISRTGWISAHRTGGSRRRQGYERWGERWLCGPSLRERPGERWWTRESKVCQHGHSLASQGQIETKVLVACCSEEEQRNCVWGLGDLCFPSMLWNIVGADGHGLSKYPDKHLTLSHVTCVSQNKWTLGNYLVDTSLVLFLGDKNNHLTCEHSQDFWASLEPRVLP